MAALEGRTPRPLWIAGARVVTPAGLVTQDLLVEGRHIGRIGPGPAPADARVLHAAGLTCGPGFVDIHVHGGGGHSFFSRDPGRIAAYAAWAPRNGVTSFLVSLAGVDPQDTDAMLAALAPALDGPEGAAPLGFHLEGPFINPKRHGAFPPSMLREPSVAEFASHQRAAGGHIRMVTLAPELPGGLDLVRAATASGAVAAMGHTDATVAEARAAFEAGISHVTHLFNAMRPLHHREGGPVVAALESGATCELIVDGAHVSPDVLQFAFNHLGEARTVVVTDNMHLAGTGEPRATFAGGEVAIDGGVARRPDGTIVGSVVTMDQHFRNVIDFLGVDLPGAFGLCSTNPARVIGAEGRGAIVEGAVADLVLLDDDLRVAATICAGEPAYLRDPGLLGPAS